MSIAADDDWYLPVEMMGDGMTEADYEEENLLEKMPGFMKKTIVSSSGQHGFFAFTSLKKLRSPESGTLITVRRPAKEIMLEFTEADPEKVFVLNPWTDGLQVSTQETAKLLSAAAAVKPGDILRLRRYVLEPRATIDIREILDAWSEGWSDSGEAQNEWEYKCCPIMADGRILLLFESKYKVYEEKNHVLHVDHTLTYYRVLEYRIEANGLRQIGKYRFSLQDGTASTVYLYDGVLRASVRAGESRKETVLQLIPNDDSKQFKIYENVRRITSRSDGSLLVGYYENLCDDARIPFVSFDPSGAVSGRIQDENALFCAEIAVDSREHFWVHLFPSDHVMHIDPAHGLIGRHRVALQGFDAMAFNNDCSKLFLDFGSDEFGSVHYILSRNENGDYINPIKFDFPPKEDENDYDGTHYPSSTMKSWVVLQAGKKLYLYDLNDLDESGSC